MKRIVLWARFFAASRPAPSFSSGPVFKVLMASAIVIGGGQADPAKAQPAPPPVVKTSQGWLQGMVSEDGSRAFLGVPYAAPPVGALRWHPPEPPMSWQGVRQATLPAVACIQPVSEGSAEVISISEDCLHLNVHVPPGIHEGDRLPVMIWLHGGGYASGAGVNYDGTALARVGRVIVVTPNYRLGVFGFLGSPALSAEDARGNHGLLDQQAAMRWVQGNIAAFGGDPERVTLFGESAGGVSVCHHLASPMARGLFHRAIIESGSCSDGLLTRAAAQKASKVLAARLACPEGDGQMACLRSRSAQAVQAAASKVDLGKLEGPVSPTPFVDGAVLPAMSADLIREGRFNRVPVLMGSNQDDSQLWVGALYDYILGRPLTESGYKSLLSLLAGKGVAAALTALYSPARYGSANLAASALMTDAVMACPTQRLARHFARHVPTYVYEFQDRTVPPPMPDPFMEWGAYHSSEVGFLMRRAWLADFRLRPEQVVLSERMMRYWSRFAATGDPNTAASWPLTFPLQANWPPFESPAWPVQRLKLGEVDTDGARLVYTQHRCLIWDATQALLGISAKR